MPSLRTRLQALGAALLLGAVLPGAATAGEPLVFIAATNHAEPLSRFENGQLVGGIVKELGDRLAQQLGREARYLSLPAKRAPQGLREGLGELICYSRPEWIGRQGLHWTPMFIPNAEVVAAQADAPALQRLEDLAGQRVGTVLGYHYGEVENQGRFLRDDAPDMAANLRKLAAGRTRYALTEAISLQAAQLQFPALREGLRLQPFVAGCALSLRSRLRPAELDAAVQALVRSGEIERLLARYR